MDSVSETASPTQNAAQRFFQYFQLEATALQQQISRMENLPSIGGERLDAFEHCLAGISRLQKEVQDASSYTTAYDQKMYSEGIRAMHVKLEETKAALAPKPKFSFKSIKKNNSALSLNDAAEIAMQQNSKIFKSDHYSSTESSRAPSPGPRDKPPKELASRPSEILRRDSLGSFLKAAGIESENERDLRSSSIRKMSFASSNEVNITSHSSVHIILPSSAAHATSSGSLVDLRHCIVDMSIPTTAAKPFAALTIKNVKSSLLICGNVNGSIHVTSVESSIVLATTRQFRMHHCHNCIVYLHVQSDPIIEDCTGIRFAPLPKTYLHGSDFQSVDNRFNKVQDFKWLKPGPSPNWNLLPERDKVPESVWSEIIHSDSKQSLDEILKASGVTGLRS